MSDGYIDLPDLGGGGSAAGVSSLNTLTGDVTLAAGSNISITPGGNTLTIAATDTTGITALTGDVAASGSGSVVATLASTGTAGTYVRVTTDAKGRVLSGLTAPQTVADGGTGSSSGFLTNAVLLGNSTSPYQTVAVGSSGTFLGSNGTSWAARSLPVSVQGPANLASSGNGGVTGTLPGANQAAANLASSGNGGVTGTLPAANVGPLAYVTSVGLSLPSIFSVTGSPVTSAGTLGSILVNQNANTFFAAPNASTGVPTFRAILGADVPAANLASSGNGGVTGTLPGANQAAASLASSGNGGVTGTLPIANGGSGQITANAALNAFLPSQTGNSGEFLTTDGSNTNWAPISLSASSGNYLSNQLTTRVTVTPAAVGQYRTYQKDLGAASGVDDAPSSGPSNPNGMRIFGVNYATQGATGETNRWEAFVGRNKTLQFEYYQNIARDTPVSADVNYYGTAVLIGLYTGYDPSSGIVFVDAIQQAATVTARVVGEGFMPNGATLSDLFDCYWDVLIK